MLKIGFAGFRHGHIFALYGLAGQNQNVCISGTWEEHEDTKEAAKKNYNIDFTHKTYQDMLEDKNIDAIAIGNYYSARGKMAIDALKAGKHVIADKPLCISLDELDEIEKLSSEKSLSVGLMLDLRYNKNVLAAKKIIEDDIIGEVHNIQFGGQHPLSYGKRASWYFEKGKHGGVINDIAIHGVDLIKYLTGLELKQILAARCWNAYADKEPNFLDSGQFILELSNRAGVIADVSYSVPNSIGFALPYYWQFLIWGKKGMLAFNPGSDGVSLYRDGFKDVQHIEGIQTSENCLQDFIDDIANKKEIILDTKTVLESSRFTLQIQEKSNS
jgi:predicted dehydrogenase